MSKMLITRAGMVCSLWFDEVDWRSLGTVQVRRASHVEFSRRRQMWFVRAARPRSALRAVLQAVLQRPCGEILHWANSRADALDWEAAYFGVGGPGWSSPRTCAQ
jgi:hypothetical protein